MLDQIISNLDHIKLNNLFKIRIKHMSCKKQNAEPETSASISEPANRIYGNFPVIAGKQKRTSRFHCSQPIA